jgi:hypothetical protein
MLGSDSVSRDWLKYIGVILAILGGFMVGFGFGISFVSASIAAEVANITSQMVNKIPLVGEWLASQIKVFLHDLIKGLVEPFNVNLILLYSFGFLMIAIGIASVYYSKQRIKKSELEALFGV